VHGTGTKITGALRLSTVAGLLLLHGCALLAPEPEPEPVEPVPQVVEAPEPVVEVPEPEPEPEPPVSPMNSASGSTTWPSMTWAIAASLRWWHFAR
jgi:outer membrane biosynthesis protein TonB